MKRRTNFLPRHSLTIAWVIFYHWFHLQSSSSSSFWNSLLLCISSLSALTPGVALCCLCGKSAACVTPMCYTWCNPGGFSQDTARFDWQPQPLPESDMIELNLISPPPFQFHHLLSLSATSLTVPSSSSSSNPLHLQSLTTPQFQRWLKITWPKYRKLNSLCAVKFTKPSTNQRSRLCY